MGWERDKWDFPSSNLTDKWDTALVGFEKLLFFIGRPLNYIGKFHQLSMLFLIVQLTSQFAEPPFF